MYCASCKLDSVPQPRYHETRDTYPDPLRSQGLPRKQG